MTDTHEIDTEKDDDAVVVKVIGIPMPTLTEEEAKAKVEETYSLMPKPPMVLLEERVAALEEAVAKLSGTKAPATEDTTPLIP